MSAASRPIPPRLLVSSPTPLAPKPSRLRLPTRTADSGSRLEQPSRRVLHRLQQRSLHVCVGRRWVGGNRRCIIRVMPGQPGSAHRPVRVASNPGSVLNDSCLTPAQVRCSRLYSAGHGPPSSFPRSQRPRRVSRQRKHTREGGRGRHGWHAHGRGGPKRRMAATRREARGRRRGATPQGHRGIATRAVGSLLRRKRGIDHAARTARAGSVGRRNGSQAGARGAGQHGRLACGQNG